MKIDLLSGKPDLSLIGSIPWMELCHAYGSAVDVPEQIEALLSPSEDVRRNVRFAFSSNLFHQGSVYPATVAAIPVFQNLLRYMQVPDRGEIVQMLANFAVGGADDMFENVDLAELIDDFKEQSSDEDLAPRECYLAVAAEVPLYESLLSDPDPRVAIAAAFTLAFFPAHAFASSAALLAIAGDDGRHAYERSSALIALSYLRGGAAHDAFWKAVKLLLQAEDRGDDRPVSFLGATAAYCIVREQSFTVGANTQANARLLATRCLERGITLPECDFYPAKKAEAGKIDARELLMPGPRFPWGNLGARLRHHVDSRLPGDVDRRVSAIMRKGAPDPDAFKVQPNAFDRDNVVAAARRLHASLWGMPLPRAAAEFEPFKPHAMLAWDEMLRLLDSDVPEDRWAAARVIEYFGPLPEAAVDQLIERLHRGDNSNLGSLILNQSISHRQCEELCQRLCRREHGDAQSRFPFDDYRSIVLKHGTTGQLRRLLAEGEFAERFAAAQILCTRGECNPREALPIFAEGLLSSHYGIAITAKMMIAQWQVAHQWFLETYDSIPKPQRWAVAEAMSVFRADLAERQADFVSLAEVEKNQVLAARLIRVLEHLSSPRRETVERLVGLRGSHTSPLVRSTIARALGRWIGKHADMDDDLIGHLQDFLADSSPRVRQAAADALARCETRRQETNALLRTLLADEDADLRRQAMWHLKFRDALSDDDVGRLLSPEQPDRIVAETLLASAGTKAVRAVLGTTDRDKIDDMRPLTNSVAGWLMSLRSPD